VVSAVCQRRRLLKKRASEEAALNSQQTQEQLDAKLVAALERVSQALHKALWEASWRSGLSSTQAQVLVYLLSHGAGKANIQELAERFGLSAATVSASVSTLEHKGLVRRQRDRNDQRVVYVHLTMRGRRQAQQLAQWTDVLQSQIAGMSVEDKERLLAMLLELIARLQRAGLISLTRMCTTCLYFQRNVHSDPRAPHHCGLMDRPLVLSELRVECPDHQPGNATVVSD